MSKFDRIIEEHLRLVENPVEEQLPIDTPEQPVDATEPVEVETALSPESEVLLIRLIRKALVTDVDPDSESAFQIEKMGDINEGNARDNLGILQRIIRNYGPDVAS